jgi:hypothetical protein
MLNFITIVAAILVAQVAFVVFWFAMMHTKSFQKCMVKWAMKYMNVCQEVVDEMEEAE